MNNYPQIRDMFMEYTVDNLKYLCANLLELLKESGIRPRGVDVPAKASGIPTRKADRAGWMTACLKESEFLRYLYSRMDTVSRSAVAELVHGASGSLDTNRFAAKYGSVPRLTVSNSRYHYRRMPDEDSEIEFEPISLVVGMGFTMAADTKKRMAEFVPVPNALSAEYVAHLPEKVPVFLGRKTEPVIRHHTAEAAINDLGAILQLVDQGKIRVSSKTGKPTNAGAKAIARILTSGDFYTVDHEPGDDWDVKLGEAGIRPFAWTMLLQGANLVQRNGTKLVLSRTGRAALKKPGHDVLKTIWERWLKTTLIHEMNRIEIIKGQKSKKRPLANARSAREQIACTLAELEPGKWIHTDHFFKFLIAAGNGYRVVRRAWALYIGHAEYGSLGYSHIGFNHVEERFGRAFLLEYAATLGVIDVALIPPWGALADYKELWGAGDFTCLSRYDGLLAIRLNALGAWILGLADEYTPSVDEAPCLQVLPNLEVTQISSVMSAPDQLFLDRVFEKTSDRVWRIDPPKMLKAVEEGVTFKSIVDFIQLRNNGPLPQPVNVFMDEIAGRIDRLKDQGESRLIQCLDEATAQLLAHDTTLKTLCFPAGKRHLAVPKDNLAPFRSRLRVLGYVLPMEF